MGTITRAGLMFEADLDVINPFVHDHVLVCRLHVTASASSEPGFFWAEGVGHDVRTGAPACVHALMPPDLPERLLWLIEEAYREARASIPERITLAGA